jgi:hypothetical protein
VPSGAEDSVGRAAEPPFRESFAPSEQLTFDEWAKYQKLEFILRKLVSPTWLPRDTVNVPTGEYL